MKEESSESYSEKEEDDVQAYVEGKVRERLDNYFNVILMFMRDIFLSQALEVSIDLKNHDKRTFVTKMATYWDTSEVEKRISLLEDTRYRIMSFANQKLTLDAFYLGLISC